MSKILSGLSLFFLTLFCSCQSPAKKPYELVEVVTEWLRQEEYQQVIQTLEAEYSLHPLPPKLLALLAHAHCEERLWETAAVHYETLTQLDPQQSDFFKRCAQCWERSNKPSQAIHFYQLYLAREPDQPETWKQLGNLQTNEKDYLGALESLLKVSTFSSYKKDGTLCNRIATLYKILQQPVKAQLWYQKSLASEGVSSSEAILNLLKLTLEQKDKPSLVRLINVLDRDFPVLQKESIVIKAQKWLQQPIVERLTPPDTPIIPKTQQMIDVKNAEKPLVLLESQENRSPTTTLQVESLDFPVGKPYVNPTDNPISVLETIVLNPPLQDETIFAVDDCQEAVVQKPTFSVLAQRALDQGNPLAAVQHYWKSLNQNPKNGEDWFSLGKAYRQLSDLQKAEIALLQAMQINPSSVPYLLEYLAVVAQTQSPNRAIRQMIQAYNRFTQEPEIVLVLAKAYQELANNSREANLYYQKFLQLAPQHPEAKDIQAILDNY